MSNSMSSAGRIASLRQRLLDRSRNHGENYQLLLDRYAVERLLYRLSISPERDQFVLKGAMLFALWFPTPHRPTRDADFLGQGPSDPVALQALVRRLCELSVDDAVRFDTDTIAVTAIREEAKYDGLRISLAAYLGAARCSVQWDVGYGDAITPSAQEVECPTLLNDLPAPRLRVYPRETVFAEKLEAITCLGLLNSRMKDYFDLLALARENVMDPDVLAQAIGATFARRHTRLPDGLPIGLTERFAADGEKQKQWQAFIKRNRLDAPALADVVASLATFSHTPLMHAAAIRRGD